MSIRSELEKLWNTASCGLEAEERDYRKNDFVVIAEQAILAEFERMLPEEKKPSYARKLSDNWLIELKLKNQRNIGYNQAITETKSNLAKLFEKEE